MRNNELVKFLNYQILKKNPSLLSYIKSKIKNNKNNYDPEIQIDCFKAIEKAIQVLQEDPQVNYEVLLSE